MRIMIIVAAALSVGAAWALGEEPPGRGRVLLLRSERALEGDIEKIEGRYRIRHGGGETWVSAEQCVRLCADWDEAFGHMKARANLADADEHLRLARWCQLNQLDGRALEEARIVLELRPGQREAQQLVALLQRRLNDPAAKAAPASKQAATAGPAPDIDLNPESLVAFKTRVQPILMNACAGCHAQGKTSGFRLYRVTEGGQQNSTRRNLAVAMAHVNLDQPAVSPLLVKAFSPHGGAAQAPLKAKEATAFRMLETWIEQVAATNPHLRAKHAAVPAESLPPAVTASPAPQAAVTSPVADDPFAPATFNEQFRPK